MGEMLACHSKNSLHLLEFIDRPSLETELVQIKRELKGYFIQQETELLDTLSEEISEYFTGRRKTFSIILDPIGTDFQKQVWNSLLKIPYGQTMSYLDQANTLGKPSSVRAIANANGKNKIAILIPCHRVIASDGSLGGGTVVVFKEKKNY
jgi:AraC family transcriptional regulator of adaptative response/methylated-DNA-[protein]-cysteine methyltransferase